MTFVRMTRVGSIATNSLRSCSLLAGIASNVYVRPMSVRLFTFVSAFRGTTHVSQVSAFDEVEAVQVWAEILRRERPFARASTYLANSAKSGASGWEPVAISGVYSVWCISSICGGDLMLTDIIETVRPDKV